MWLKKTVAVVIGITKKQDSIFNIIQEIDSTGHIDEILVIGNSVSENTLKQIQKTRARFIKINKKGLGRSIKTGLDRTKADLVIVTDSKGTFKGKDISKLLSYSQDFDTVFGSRTHVSLIRKDSGMNFVRRIVDDIFGKIISILFLSSNLTDVGCSFRLTNKKGWKKVKKECKSNSDLFLTEWLIMAAKNKVRFIEIPVNFTAPKLGLSNNNFFYLTFKAIVILFLILKTWILSFVIK